MVVAQGGNMSKRKVYELSSFRKKEEQIIYVEGEGKGNNSIESPFRKAYNFICEKKWLGGVNLPHANT